MQRFLTSLALSCALFLVPVALVQGETRVPLSRLDLSHMHQGWGEPQVDRNIVGEPMRIAGEAFSEGVGTHADSVIRVQLDGDVRRFSASVGIDESAGGRGTVRFRVYVDGKVRFDSGVLRGGAPAKDVDVDLSGAKPAILWAGSAGDGIDYDHADWADAAFYLGEQQGGVRSVAAPEEPKVILTPKPGPEPRINGPKVYGCRPECPFLYRIPVTGERPMRYAAEGLPESLRLDPATGIIRGHSPQNRGEYVVSLRAENDRGADTRPFRIVVGDTLALTPPMGWNHWYTWYAQITGKKMREAADVMISSGMADVGYSYVNIDDCWMVKPGDPDPKRAGEPRNPDGTIRPNDYFPDMAGLAEYIHSKGLKAGLYTSPGPTTCQGYTGAYRYEELDADTFARWGFDFLKYDWCSYGQVAEGEGGEYYRRPYRKMGENLVEQDRDIVYNLCQYGMGEVWKWAADVHGNCWRTTGDLGLARGTALPGFYHIGFANAEHHEYAQPGHWNDPDYILIGYVGNARDTTAPPVPTSLTPNEQYSYMSMWCLMAAPLFYSGDMGQLDEFTLNVLCNPEVIEINQDPLGKQAPIVRRSPEDFVMAKPLEDGSLAVGLFNIAEIPVEVTVNWQELGREGPQRVRDLWRHKELGVHPSGFQATVPRHGVMLIRVWDEQ